MKDLQFEFTNASDYLKRNNDALWKLYFTKAPIYSSIVLVIIGVISLVVSIDSGYSDQSVTVENSSVKKILDFDNLLIGLGVGSIFLAGYTLYVRHETKKNFLDLWNKRIARYQKTTNSFSYLFNKQGVGFENHDTKRFHQWEYYSDFTFYGDFLFIFSNFVDRRIPVERIPIDILANDDLNALKELINNKLYKR